MEYIFKIIPKINHPISLVAFTLALILIVIKLVLSSKKLKPLRQNQSFILLNKLLNYFVLFSIVVIILAFGLIFYQKYSETSLEKESKVDLLSLIEESKSTALKLKRNRLTTSEKDKIMEIQPHIYKLGKNTNIEKAYTIIKNKHKKIGTREYSPAFLAISDDVLFELLLNPFNYCYGPRNYRWGQNGGDWFYNDLIEENELDIEKLTYLINTEDQFAYKDFLFFLNGNFERIIRDYPNSIIADAAVYAQIKSSLLYEDYDTAIEYAEIFKKLYPDHRHLDDAYALKVIAYELSGRSVDAFYAARQGFELPDGDMREWFYEEMFFIAERFMDSKELKAIIDQNANLKLIGNYQYTYAHHLMAEKKYAAALSYFKKLKSNKKLKLAWPFFYSKERPVDLEIANDIILAEELTTHSEDDSLSGKYMLGLIYFNNELIHYNQLYKGRRNSGDESRESRTPEKYFELRNNFYLAAHYFSIVANATEDLELKQKSLYKLARCYQHLSYSIAFYTDTIGHVRRISYGKHCINTFLKGMRIYPEGDLSDDCLVEAGFLSAYLIGDLAEGKRLLKLTISEYGDRNSADNALYHLAMIYKDSNEYIKAIKTLIQLSNNHLSIRWKIISNQEIKSLREEAENN
jgi:tetratricopeptide (TPR) repeat protein